MASESAHQRLNNLVIGTELTLISIVQGVALYFLADATKGVIDRGDTAAIPYAATGLLLILTVWSRSIMHALTIVRWPIEFVHSFLYIGIALGESLLFTSVGNPERWFLASTLLNVIVWFTYVFDLFMIDRAVRLRRGAGGVCERAISLYQEVRVDQKRKIKFIIPALILLNGAFCLCITKFPEIFIREGWHFAFIGFQFFMFIGYIIINIKNFNALTPLILEAEDEEDNLDI